jgi:8-oxo-dGTP pyrophosphatase MutT (NUDIX family)
MRTIDRLQYLRAGLKGLFAPVSLGVCAIATGADGRVLLVRHTYRPGWYLPGGGVHRRETGEAAVMRELAEEVGLVRADAPMLFGFYLRRNGRHGDYIAAYTVKDAVAEFRPNAEIAELCFADPKAPPPGTSAGTLRRLAEFAAKTNRSPEW